MIAARGVAQDAAFAEGRGGRRFRIVSQPADGRCVGTVIWVHAFAEEMNKTRRLSALMARLLASEGWRVVQKDLSGCGDSTGDFGEASWAAWVDDVKAELLRVDPQRPTWLWCVRAGALVASAALDRRIPVNLLLWQPVMSGAHHLRQFLRLQTGARVLGSAKVGTAALPSQSLEAGAAVEIGGYLLAPALASGLRQATFDLPSSFAGRIAWFELSPDTAPMASPATTKAVENLRARGITVDVEALTGPEFWQTQEIEESEALLQRSLHALATPDRGARAMTVGEVVRSQSEATSEAVSGERPLSFRCGNERLWGILAPAASQPEGAATAVVIAVGGPQYRVGSHRQFVFLARRLAEHGYTSLRFDYRGMGDSEGEKRGFEDVGPDLNAAIDALQRACPAVRNVVVWGLCDGASTAMTHAVLNRSVSGIVAVNPWVRSEASLAATRVRHYYLARLVRGEFWAKVIRGRLDIRASIGALLGDLKRASRSAPSGRGEAFQERMAGGLAVFRGRVLLIISGNDLTAKEFLQYTAASAQWRGLLASDRISRIDLPQADHTFSSATWRKQVEDATIAWLRASAPDADAAARVGPAQGVTFYRDASASG
jgi:exosortase A-associated hydrolase 1/exosortase A-associated hydrolase 2